MPNKNNKKKTQTEQTWNAISGVMRVYGNTFKNGKNEVTKWSVTISGKGKDDDEYTNFYVTVRFRGDSEEPETDGLHTIDISNAFWSIEKYTNKDGHEVVTPVIVVTDCAVVD